MSVQAIDWALREGRGISPTQKLILLCLADQAGPNGTCWSSQDTVLEYSGLLRKTLNRNLSDLEKRGFIRSIHRRDEAGGELSKTYALNLQKGEAS